MTASIVDRFADAIGELLERFRAEGMTLEAIAEALGFELDAVEHAIEAEEGEDMSMAPDIDDAAKVRILLGRLSRFVTAKMAEPVEGTVHDPDDPTTMLFEAEEMIEDLAMRCGLLETPRTISRKTDWDKVEATTEAQIAQQIIEDCKE